MTDNEQSVKLWILFGPPTKKEFLQEYICISEILSASGSLFLTKTHKILYYIIHCVQARTSCQNPVKNPFQIGSYFRPSFLFTKTYSNAIQLLTIFLTNI